MCHAKSWNRSYIIHHVQSTIKEKEHSSCIYIYISQLQGRENPDDLRFVDEPTLVGQLLPLGSSLPKELINCYEARRSAMIRPSRAESSELLRSIVNRYSRIFLVIDAFDESSEECGSLLLTEILCLRSRFEYFVRMKGCTEL